MGKGLGIASELEPKIHSRNTELDKERVILELSTFWQSQGSSER